MSTKRIQIAGSLDDVKMITLHIGNETKTLRIVGDGQIWGSSSYPNFVFDETTLDLQIDDTGETAAQASAYVLNDDTLTFVYD